MEKKLEKHANIPSFMQDIVRILFCLILFFGFLLGTRPLSVPDESRYSEIPREMLAAQDYLTPTLNTLNYFEKPPLLYWIQTVSFHTFGLNEWAARIPTACFSMITCLWIYILGRALYGRRTGLLSCGVLATSTLYFVFTHVVTIDMLLTLLFTLTLGSFLWVSEGRNTKTTCTTSLRQYETPLLYIAYVATACAILAKGLVGILLPTGIIGLWFVCTNRWSLIRYLKLPQGILIILLLSAPWHIIMAKLHPEFPQFYFIDQQFSRYLTDIAQRYQPFWFFIPIILSGWLPWAVFLPQSLYATFKNCREQTNNSQLFLLLWSSCILIFFSISHSKLVPYILPTFPPTALIIGQYLAKQWENNQLNMRCTFGVLGALGVIGSIACFTLPSLLPILTNAPESKPYLYLLGVCMGISFLSSAWFGFRTHFRKAIIVLLLSYSSVLFAVVLAAPHIDTRSAKPLAMLLTQKASPQDVIILYDLYYQDLPFYLRRAPLVIVNGWGELTFGTTHAKIPPHWMWRSTDFEHYLDTLKVSPHPSVWIVISKQRYDAWPEQQKNLFITEGNTVDHLLLRYNQ